MATERRVWVVEEVDTGADIGQRQTMGTFSDNEDGTWHWDRPDNRLDEAGKQEWDRVMGVLSNVNGEDLRHVVCFAGLLDHCLSPQTREEYTN